MIKFCEEPNCRHGEIAKYFGDEKPECNKSCDYCKNRKMVERDVEHFHGGVFAGSQAKGAKSRGYMFVIDDSKEDDPDLYGGGRRGAKREWESDDDEADHDEKEKREQREKKQRTTFIMKEFEKRRAASSKPATDDFEEPPNDCPLRDASSRRIPKLSYKIREHCLQLLEEALYNNYCTVFSGNDAKLCQASYVPRCCAIDLEYQVLGASKLANSYRMNIMKKVNAVKKLTNSKEIHESLVPQVDSTTTEASSVFITASELLEKREKPACNNGDEFQSAIEGTSSDFQSAIKLRVKMETDSVDEGESIKYESAKISDKDKQLNGFKPFVAPSISYFFENKEEPELVIDSKEGASCASSHKLDSASNDSPECAINSDSKQVPKVTYSSDQSGEETRKNKYTSSLGGVKDSKSQIKGVLVKRKSKESTDKLGSKNKDSLSKSKQKGVKFGNDHVYPISPRKKSLQDQAELSLNGTKVTSSLANDTTQTDVPVKPEKALAAELVLKYLSPHYKAGKFASKDLFKSLAKKISYQLVSDNTVGKEHAKRRIHQFFEKCKKVTSPADFDN